MIDLHTHLLPEWDNGAKDWKETIMMIKAAEKDGIKKLGLTPHLYRMTKYKDDMRGFGQRIAEFMLWAERFELEFFWGAEVFIDDHILKNIQNNNLSMNKSNYVFVEFPPNELISGVEDLFYHIMLEGYIPIISHPERNPVFAGDPEILFDLVQMGALAQVTAKSILGEFGQKVRKAAKVFLKHNLVHLVASDAHSPDDWPPVLGKAIEKAEKIVGAKKAVAMVNEIPQAILDNQAIPNYGDPINPKRRRWKTRILSSFHD